MALPMWRCWKRAGLGGNSGRNTTIVRSNYFVEGNTAFYEHSLKLWEGLSQDLNYNVMFSQRGHLNLFFTPGQRDAMMRRYNIMRLNGIDGEFLNREQVQKMVPHLNYGDQARLPILGGFLQARAGTARHDAVNWAMPGRHLRWVWISSRIVRSPALSNRLAA